jgi:iron-sulfur cluster assembly accessory protein
MTMAVIEQDLVRVTPVPMVQPLIDVSMLAAQRLSAMMTEKELTGYALRVFVSGGGCSGLQYGMTFDDEMRDGDAEFDSHGLRVVVDPISARYLSGASIDFSDNLLGGGFKIENPNAVSSCGCGHSFRTNEDGGEDEGHAGGGCSSCSSH